MPARFLPFHRTCAWLSATFLLVSIAARAAPVLEETLKLTPPEPDYYWIAAANTSLSAIDGDRIIAAAHKPFVAYDPQAVFILERASNGTWIPHKIFERDDPNSNRSMTVNIKGNVAAIVASAQLMIYERTASGWSQTASMPVHGGNDGVDLEIDATNVIVGGTVMSNGVLHSAGLVYRKNSAGQWSYVRSLLANPIGAPFTHETFGANVEVSGNSILLSHYQVISGDAVVSAHVYEGNSAAGTWTRTAILPTPPNFKGAPRATIDGNYIIMIGAPVTGPSRTAVFVKSGGVWTYDTSASQITAPEQFRLEMTDIATVAASGGTALIGLYQDEDRDSEGGSVRVYRRGVNGVTGYQPVAELLASDSWQQLALGYSVDISGNRIITTSGDGSGIYLYQLPATLPAHPAVLQEDFQDNVANSWISTPTSAWSIVAGSTSRVYRQSSTAAESISVRSNVDWTNQSIDAYVKPTAVSGSDRWFGLFVRQSDANNYYYVTVRTSNVVQIKKMVNGTFTTLASVPFNVTMNRTYNLRLEAIGTWLRVYVDAVPVAQARDASLTHGLAGLRTYRVAADFDNVVISPNPTGWLLYSLLDHYYDRDSPDSVPTERRQWVTSGSGVWTFPDNRTVWAQTSTAADARAVAGFGMQDTALSTRLRAVGFNGSDRWFGVLTRYQNASNYYYVTLRSSNRIELKRLVNGTATVLDSATLTVSPGTTFDLRIEDVGSAHRVYVNGVLTLEANDSTFTTGKIGFATYKTSAEFEFVEVKQL
jgi:hypothetical protein